MIHDRTDMTILLILTLTTLSLHLYPRPATLASPTPLARSLLQIPIANKRLDNSIPILILPSLHIFKCLISPF